MEFEFLKFYIIQFGQENEWTVYCPGYILAQSLHRLTLKLLILKSNETSNTNSLHRNKMSRSKVFIVMNCYIEIFMIIIPYDL